MRRMGLHDVDLTSTGSLARQGQFSLVIARRLEKIEKNCLSFTVTDRKLVLQEQINKAGRIVTLAKNFISSSSVCPESHAAIAWAGVCMLLPVSISAFHS